MAHNEKRNTMERLQELIAGESYEKADQVFQDYLSQGGQYDDELAIYDAAIGQGMGNSERIWVAICQGLLVNPENYELYVLMGDYYLDENGEQSWLCYEHALACCQNQEDQAQIKEMQRQLTEDCGISAGRTAVVIWCHGGVDSVRRCVESVRTTLVGCAGQIVAVADQCEPVGQE